MLTNAAFDRFAKIREFKVSGSGKRKSSGE